MNAPNWIDVGDVETLSKKPLQEVLAHRTKIALSYKDGHFHAISGACNHVGGPLGEGVLDGDYVTCPWHYWKFHHRTGEGEPGFEADKVPAYAVKVENGRVLVDASSADSRTRLPHPPHALAREVVRQPGPLRLLFVSTTAMTAGHPRYSTSDALLNVALEHARTRACETQMIELRDLKFRACEGFYSKAARACTWPCSITQIDSEDQMDRVYEAFVHWADAVIVGTPIRWGSASSLYYKMVERMNCIQNQETIAHRSLIKSKTAAFIITGGQDNIQSVAGQMLGFFAEIGFHFPKFPYVAHSRGWSAEDMENNVRYVQESDELRKGTAALVDRTLEMAKLLVGDQIDEGPFVGGGRKAAPI